MMTTMAAMLGALPLAFGIGDGAEMRQPLGISIVGGLIVSQVLTLYTTPVMYLYLDRFGRWSSRAVGATVPGRRPAAPAAPAQVYERAPLETPCHARSRGACCDGRPVRGCAVGPNYHRPAAPVPQRFKEAEGWKPAEPREAASGTDWWSVYDDPMLDELEKQIDISNQTLKASEAAWRQAVAVVSQARARLFPTVGVTRTAHALGRLRRARDCSRRCGIVAAAPTHTRVNQFELDGQRPPGISTSGARSAAPSRATSRMPRRVRPSSRPRGSPRRRRSPATTSSCASRTSSEQLLDETVEAYKRSLEITAEPVQGRRRRQGRRDHGRDAARGRRRRSRSPSASRAQHSSTPSPC